MLKILLPSPLEIYEIWFMFMIIQDSKKQCECFKNPLSMMLIIKKKNSFTPDKILPWSIMIEEAHLNKWSATICLAFLQCDKIDW